MKRTLVALLMMIAPFSLAKDISVGKTGDYQTIQEAVNVAEKGDRILIGEGTFNEEVTIKPNTPMTIEGSGIENTIVKGYNRNIFTSAVFYGEEATSVTLRNMTLTNAWSGAFFRNCNEITMEYILSVGNGENNAYFKGSKNTLVNHCTMDGTSIFGETNCGVDYENLGDILCTTNTLINSIIVNHKNIGVEFPVEQKYYDHNLLISFNNFHNNSLSSDWRTTATLIGNISDDPLFVDVYKGKYELDKEPITIKSTYRSPCIDSGTSDGYTHDGYSDMGCFNKYGKIEENSAVSGWWYYE